MARSRKLPTALRSAELKLKRANLHAQTMRREVKRFLDAHPPPAIDGRFEDDYTEYVIYVIEDFATPPDSFLMPGAQYCTRIGKRKVHHSPRR